MMYSEFLELSKMTENDITTETYSKVIEPMCMATNMDKRDFVKMLNIKHIKAASPNANNIANEMVEVIKDMKVQLGHTTLHQQENRFIELAENFCKLKNMEFCYTDFSIYEFPNDRGCSMYTGFVARSASNCHTYYSYKVVGNNLKQIDVTVV